MQENSGRGRSRAAYFNDNRNPSVDIKSQRLSFDSILIPFKNCLFHHKKQRNSMFN